jgi:hypothetical protein
MGIRFESNFQRLAGAGPVVVNDNDPLTRWLRVHEWQVDPGYTGKLLMIMLNVEPQFPVPGTTNYGTMRVSATLDAGETKWVTKWEHKMVGAALTAKQFTPRLAIIPIGSGITFTEGQGLMTTALPAVTNASYRWWSCYVIDAGVV